MKSSRVGENQAVCLQQEAFNVPESRDILINSPSESVMLRYVAENSRVELSEKMHCEQLIDENQKLKILVTDLMQDKLRQARRIKELNEEKVRLKKKLAEIIIDHHS